MLNITGLAACIGEAICSKAHERLANQAQTLIFITRTLDRKAQPQAQHDGTMLNVTGLAALTGKTS